jgi:hypothetical protein
MQSLLSPLLIAFTTVPTWAQGSTPVKVSFASAMSSSCNRLNFSSLASGAGKC